MVVWGALLSLGSATFLVLGEPKVPWAWLAWVPVLAPPNYLGITYLVRIDPDYVRQGYGKVRDYSVREREREREIETEEHILRCHLTLP